MIDPLKHWEPIAPGEAARCECAQLVDGQWYAPRWGSDTLAAMLDEIEACEAEAAVSAAIKATGGKVAS